jgi:Flp pilus assembly protein TadG
MRCLGHDRRGTTALEFGLVAPIFFSLLFGIIDLGRYGITVYSLNTLASANARAVAINDCYSWQIMRNLAPSCTNANLLTAAQNQTAAPFLYALGLTPTVNLATGGNTYTITARQTTFNMLMPFWGTALSAPSIDVIIPF